MANVVCLYRGRSAVSSTVSEEPQEERAKRRDKRDVFEASREVGGNASSSPIFSRG